MTRFAALTFLILFWAIDASACGVCVTAAADLILPPIVLWMLLSITWFVSNGVFRSVSGAILPFQPATFGALVIALLGFIAGAAVLGPLTVLPLAIPPAYAFIRSVIQRRSGEAPLRMIGFIHVAAAVVTFGFMVYTLRTRTDAQFITRWAGSAIGRAKFAHLRGIEPASLNTYRAIVAGDNGALAGEAAERIGDIGQPVVDVPLLQGALLKFDKNPEARDKIAAALFRLRTRRAG